MTKRQAYVAFDLGAESGRAMLAFLEGDRLTLEEAHRFPNLPQQLPSGLHWNLLDLWRNLLEGLRRCGEIARERSVKIASLGVDTWGVDFGLVGKNNQLLGLPYAYRDARNAPAMKTTRKWIGDRRLYDATGIQFLPFNSLFQLVAQNKQQPELLPLARHMLFMPDLLHFFFCGKAVNEATIASTSQMVNPRTGKWDKKLLADLNLPAQMLGRIVPAGTKIGSVRPEVLREVGITEGIDVIAPGTHDTASAVAAVPVDMSESKPWVYLSSGTWSLMGAEIDKPVLTDAARKAGFTHERGVGGKIRFLRNIAGLWLVQECRRDFARRGQQYDYGTLTTLAVESEPFRTLVDPAHAPFGSPGDMPAKIAAFARATGQPAPKTPGQFVRCCIESLAMAYRHTLVGLEQLLGCRAEVLHIVGGGGQNGLLNQLAADAINRTVIVGPYEATAIGNALTQAIGTGQIKNLAHLRKIVRESFSPVTYHPHHPEAFDQHWQRYQKLLGK